MFYSEARSFVFCIPERAPPASTPAPIVTPFPKSSHPPLDNDPDPDLEGSAEQQHEQQPLAQHDENGNALDHFHLPQPQTPSFTVDSFARMLRSPPTEPDHASLKHQLVRQCRRTCAADIRKRRACPKRRQAEAEIRALAERFQHVANQQEQEQHHHHHQQEKQQLVLQQR